jgi:hypothetical protein
VLDALREMVAYGQPMADHATIGTVATLEGAHQDAVRAFHDRWYRPENAAIIVSGDIDPRLWEVDARLCAEFVSLRTSVNNFYRGKVWIDVAKDPTDFAVVQPHRLARLGVVENLWQRQTDTRGRNHLAVLSVGRGPAGRAVAIQNERIPGSEQQDLRKSGKLADVSPNPRCCAMHAGCGLGSTMHLNSGLEVDCLGRLGPATLADKTDDAQGAPG